MSYKRQLEVVRHKQKAAEDVILIQKATKVVRHQQKAKKLIIHQKFIILIQKTTKVRHTNMATESVRNQKATKNVGHILETTKVKHLERQWSMLVTYKRQ